MGSWLLDLKLGLRMLVKYPGLALAGGAGIAVAVAIAAGGYSAVAGNYAPGALPLPESERLVVIEEWDTARNRVEERVGFDFAEWRRSLRSVGDLAAFQTVTANLIQEGVTPGSVRVAEMTASGFAAARVQPLVGRVLVEGDANVAVVGENLWRSRLGASRSVVGSSIRLGAENYTVVGVMPEGFGFPVNHEVWVPLGADAAMRGPAEGMELTVFGRLAEGATIESAQAELATFAGRRAREFSEIYGKLRVQALPFPYPFLAMHTAQDVGGLYVMQGLVASLLVLVCLNVAILVFTRTSTRQTEMAVRTALGASRRRIVGQLFVEALVLASFAAGVGVMIAAWAMRELQIATIDLSRELPYWVAFRLTPDGVLYALVLAVVAAAIIGIVPAWQATRVGASKRGMGKVWSALVVAQVAFAVALLPAGAVHGWDSMRQALAQVGFPAEAFLSAELVKEDLRVEELIRRVREVAGVEAVTYSRFAPGDEKAVRVEAETLGAEALASHSARWNEVEQGFFRSFGLAFLAGRDLSADAGVVVNESFAKAVFGGDALGKRFRLVDGAWREVVGVVRDFPEGVSPGMEFGRMAFYSVAPAGMRSVSLSVRVRGGDAAAFASKLREVAAKVDPEMLVRDVNSLEAVMNREQWIRKLEAGVIGAVTLSVLALSSAGIYALLSFTVSQRKKEIGIRTALGADRLQILREIFSRAFRQVGAGVALGVVMALGLEWAAGGDLLAGSGAIVLPGVALLMMLVGAAATAGPARRCLGIQPTDALREQ